MKLTGRKRAESAVNFMIDGVRPAVGAGQVVWRSRKVVR